MLQGALLVATQVQLRRGVKGGAPLQRRASKRHRTPTEKARSAGAAHTGVLPWSPGSVLFNLIDILIVFIPAVSIWQQIAVTFSGCRRC